MTNKVFSAIVLAAFVAVAMGECPNACSAHGKCGAYDMCTCYRNWMANDCSERICQFGVAHVDTPKGDLDASGGVLSGPGTTVVMNDAVYPYGTTEQFPDMLDSEDNVLTNTAHGYYECSNKGVCDRATGTCACFDGYDGSACQRQSCPTSSAGVCSGHGVCESISTLASRDFNNIYKLWDDQSTMGCRCDGGYSGPDCSQKMCKFGADPLYYDDSANIRYSNFTYHIYTLGDSTTAIAPGLAGNYSLWFEDKTGESWQTVPIDINATCTEVTDALEGLPNNVIPKNTVRCYQHPVYASTNVPIWFATIDSAADVVPNSYPILSGGVIKNHGTRGKFTLAFPSNPGYLKQIQINKYLDGARPTLYTTESINTLNWFIYANGFTGEDTDYVPDKCEGVTVTLATGTVNDKLVITTAEEKLLKTCLGDSDGDPTNNVEVYNWDYGNRWKKVPRRAYAVDAATDYWMIYSNPHLIKLVDATQDSYTYTDEPDSAMYPFPKTQLCNNVNDKVSAYYGLGWCADYNRPGFFAVIYYDGTSFRSFNRISKDYGTTTPFYVYTTTGYLNRVSPVAFQANELIGTYRTTASLVHSAHTNNFYSQNISGFASDYFGNIDCETNSLETGYYANDCLDKEDNVFFLSVAETSTSYPNNPRYLNMYTVKKIGTSAPLNGEVHNVAKRNQITLDFGVNAHYWYDNSAAQASIESHLVANNTLSVEQSYTQLSYAATAYKFHKPAGYNYVGQCSNRGICDTTTGICNCFAGHTGDNCGNLDALAQ